LILCKTEPRDAERRIVGKTTFLEIGLLIERDRRFDGHHSRNLVTGPATDPLDESPAPLRISNG
jgi:hypothetical protein